MAHCCPSSSFGTSRRGCLLVGAAKLRAEENDAKKRKKKKRKKKTKKKMCGTKGASLCGWSKKGNNTPCRGYWDPRRRRGGETQDEKRSVARNTERAATGRDEEEFLARCQLSMSRTLSLILRAFSSRLEYSWSSRSSSITTIERSRSN